jgi:hypothetical protein
LTLGYLVAAARAVINLTDWSKFAYVWGSFSAIATFVALLVGGIWALRRCHREVRLQAADLLLKMEEEYRQILPTCFGFEDLGRYQKVLLPVLN